MTNFNQTPISELEGLEILYGPKPLLSFQNRFPTRPALLNYYGYALQQHFSTHSLSSAICEICNQPKPPAALIFNSWTVITRLYWLRLLLLILLLPILAFLAIVHMGVLVGKLLEGLKISDKITFRTTHSVCKECRRNLKLRALLWKTLNSLFVILLPASICAIIMGALSVLAFFNVGGFARQDFAIYGMWFALGLGVSIVVLPLNRFLLPWVRISKPLRMVKRPYYLSESMIQMPSSPASRT